MTLFVEEVYTYTFSASLATVNFLVFLVKLDQEFGAVVIEQLSPASREVKEKEKEKKQGNFIKNSVINKK
jgi:hypothetical protein